MVQDYKYSFRKYKGVSSKVSCPECGRKHCFSLFVYPGTEQVISDKVGRCDHENKCGHIYTPSQYFADSGNKPQHVKQREPEPEKPLDYLPSRLLDKATAHPANNNLYKFFVDAFSEAVADDLFRLYRIGSSKHWEGATLFNQVDINGNYRHAKVILYNPATGKRIKEGETVRRFNRVSGEYETIQTDVDCCKVYGRYLTKETNGLNLKQCFYGECLLTQYPGKRVAICESEKTATAANVYLPEFIWLATGGVHGCKWTNYEVFKVLEGREVVLFPDCGQNKKTGKRFYTEWEEIAANIKRVLRDKVKITVSDILEVRATDEQKANGADFLDLILHRDDAAGWAYKDSVNRYPAFWDYMKNLQL